MLQPTIDRTAGLRRIGAFAALTCVLALGAPGCIDAADEDLFRVAGLSAVPSGPLSFAEHIEPIFQKNGCTVCHRAGGGQGGFDVTSVAGIRRGGDSTLPGVVSCDVAASELFFQIDECDMPPGSRCLSDTEQDTVAKWIEQGGMDTFLENVCENPPLD